MWKIGGLVFTHGQLVRLFKRIHPERAEEASNTSAVYQAVIALALKKNLDFMPVSVAKPNGGRGTRFILCIYSGPAETVAATSFERWQEGEEVARVRRWLAARDFKKRLPFDTFIV